MEPGWLDEIEPVTSPPFVRMGTRALGGEAEWLLGGDDVPAQLAEKHRILAAHHDDVVAAIEGTEEAAAELLAAVRLASSPASQTPGSSGSRAPSVTPAPPVSPARSVSPASGFPGSSATSVPPGESAVRGSGGLPGPPAASEWTARQSDRPSPPRLGHPIEGAGRMVAEDLCVVVRRGGRWVLGAGSVCFPSHWRLGDKVGKPLAEVHGPVPDYAADLAGRVDRFLDKLRVGRGVWRRNWTVHARPDLYAPDVPPPPGPPVTAGDAGPRLWLRSERQTLTRLPRTDAIAFTIRTQQVRLAAVAGHPHLRARLAEAVAAWPPHQTAYRGGEALRQPLLAWLTGQVS